MRTRKTTDKPAPRKSASADKGGKTRARKSDAPRTEKPTRGRPRKDDSEKPFSKSSRSYSKDSKPTSGEKRNYRDNDSKENSYEKRKSYGDNKRSYSKNSEERNSRGEKRNYRDNDKENSYEKRKSYDDNKRSYSRNSEERNSRGEKRNYRDSDSKENSYEKRKSYGDNKRSYSRNSDDKGSRYEKRESDSRTERKSYRGNNKEKTFEKGRNTYNDDNKRSSYSRNSEENRNRYGRKKAEENFELTSEENEDNSSKRTRRPRLDDRERTRRFDERKASERGRKSYGNPESKTYSSAKSRKKERVDEEEIRLNKYISNAGICSRREADVLIESGVVSVNGKVVTEMGYKVKTTDVVLYGDQRLSPEKKRYVLLNKPKGFITTVDDPFERKTVMSLVANACKERIYPVGRLDRNTTGLLLFTNDGELAKRLTHPSHGARKVYHVELDKALTKRDMDTIEKGLSLEDGHVEVDAILYDGDGSDKKKIGIELHTGKNRIVRRVFESLGYEVVKLDRVIFASLTKKDLKRGDWRFLTEKEVSFLHMA